MMTSAVRRLAIVAPPAAAIQGVMRGRVAAPLLWLGVIVRSPGLARRGRQSRHERLCNRGPGAFARKSQL